MIQSIDPPTPGRLSRVIGGLVSAVLVLMVTASCASPLGAVLPHAQSPGSYHGITVHPAMPKPEFVLTDTSGSAFDFQTQSRGRVTLLYFGYTHCPDACPAQMATIATALRQAGAETARKVEVVFVTTDPQRDTPDVLRVWLNHFNTDFIGLTGSEADINLVEKEVGAPASRQEAAGDGNYSVDHDGYVIVYTPDELGHLIYPEGVSPAHWSSDLIRLAKNG